MQTFKNILAVVDTTADHHPVLDQAARIATKHKAALLVVDVVPEFTWPQKLLLGGTEHLRDLLAREKNDKLKKLLAPLQQKGIAAREKVLVGKSSEEITRQVLRGKHDLVLRRTKGTRSQRPGNLGTTSIELLRNCPCTVWLFDENRPQVGRVLAAVDATPDDESHAALNNRILEAAATIAALDKVRWDVAHVWNIYGERLVKDYMKTKDFAELERATRAECIANLNALVKPFGIGAKSDRLHLLRGDPNLEIPQLVTEGDIDLLVMGTVARRGVSGWLLGNTAEQVLGQVRCSILAVKPEGFVSPIKAKGSRA